jgi:hypothetical protein
MSIPITPATKVAALLEAWPALEEVLVAQAPAFARLRNPVLRRTIARVATLEQAAAIAGLRPRDLVAALRRAAGQPIDPPDDAAPQPPACGVSGTGVRSEAPSVEEATAAAPPTMLIDADALLDAGQAPLTPVFNAANRLQDGEVLNVQVSFRPVPLIEHLERHGFRHRVGQATDGRLLIEIVRGAPRAADPPDGEAS